MPQMLIQQQMNAHYISIAQKEPPTPKSKYATTHFICQENGSAD
jgi:hypothetical protein